MAILVLDYIKCEKKENGRYRGIKSLVVCDLCNKERTVYKSNLAKGDGIKHCPKCCRIKTSKEDFMLMEVAFDVKLSDSIPNLCAQNTNWICNKCNYIWTISLINIKRSNGCPKCSHMRQFPNFYNGDPKRQKHDSKAYKIWTKEVFKRDNYLCQKCFLHGNLNAHHIFNWSKFYDLRFDINNGITLCERHHLLKYENSFHKIYGTRNNNLTQVEEFINGKILQINKEHLLNKVNESMKLTD